MDSLGISFGEGNHATIKMAKGAFNILKTKLIDKVKSWFEEFGGGDGSYLFNYPIWQRFGSYTGGLDLMVAVTMVWTLVCRYKSLRS